MKTKIVIFMILVIIGLSFGCVEKEDLEYQGSASIYSLTLNDESQISGSFFLGCGSVLTSNNMCYYYYVEDKVFGGMVLQNSLAEETTIKVTDRSPYIEEYGQGMYKHYVLYVPENTVKIDFNVEI